MTVDCADGLVVGLFYFIFGLFCMILGAFGGASVCSEQDTWECCVKKHFQNEDV